MLRAELRCALRTLSLLGTHRLALPRSEVGRLIGFADGTMSRVYRETAMRPRNDHPDLVVLIVKFRLRWLGSSRLGHALFRFESLFNTLLFAGHDGFETKLWLTDLRTGSYRGLYEWHGHDSAAAYAEVLRVVLQPWVEEGTFDYRIVTDLGREGFLDGEAATGPDRSSLEGWWAPVPAPALS